MAEKNLLEQYKAERDNDLEMRRKLLSEIPEEEFWKASALEWRNALDFFEKKYPGLTLFEIQAGFCNFTFNFSAVQKFLEKLPNLNEKLKFLFEIKADFERKSKNEFLWVKKHLNNDVLHFSEDCQIEIEKLEKLKRLEETPKQTANQDERIPPKEREGINIECAFLFFHYLSENPNATNNKTKILRAIELLTGYKIGQLNKLPSWLKAEKAKCDENIGLDKKIFEAKTEACKLFELFGLTECIKIMNDDLGE